MEKRAVLALRGRILGAGRPWLCAPLMGRERADILREAQLLRESPAEAAEWRYDQARESLAPADIPAFLEELREALGELPLIFTYRTPAELAGGGPLPPDYLAALEAAGEGADLLDVEWNRGEALLPALRGRGKSRLLFSCHDFAGTPPAEEMEALLLRMEDGGADAVKLAVTPRCPEDVLALLTATARAHSRLRVPLITMSMGKLGMASRLCGGLFGSALTFGAAQSQSAPGQPPLAELARILGLLYDGE